MVSSENEQVTEADAAAQQAAEVAVELTEGDRIHDRRRLAVALNGVARVRSLARIIYQGAVGYRIKPPKGFGRNVVTEAQLRQLLDGSGFRVGSAETIRDSSRSSNIPVQYVRAAKT